MGRVAKGGSYDEARTRKMNADAGVAELDLARLHGELCLKSDVVSAWVATFSSLRSRLLSIPSKAAPLVSPTANTGECQVILDVLIEEALNELSNYDPILDPTGAKQFIVDAEGGNGSPKTSSSSKRRRVGRPRKAVGLAE